MNETNIKKLHALLYSHSQGAFHASTVGAVVNDGLNSFRKHRPPSDWILVGISENEDDISELGRKLTLERAGAVTVPPPLPRIR